MNNTILKIETSYRQLTSELTALSWIARGNVYRRFLTRKVDGKNKKCGPYYLLTRKQAGKTITHALNEEQFHLYSQAIENHKKADAIFKKLRKLTVTFIQLSTPKLPSRQRKQQA